MSEQEEQEELPEHEGNGFLDIVMKVLHIFHGIPKTIGAIVLILSMVSGYAVFKPEEQSAETDKEMSAVEKRLLVLETTNQLLKEMIIRILTNKNQELDLDSFLIELPSGDITRIKE